MKVPSLGAQNQAKQVALFDVSMANKGSSASLQTRRTLSSFLPITHNTYNGVCKMLTNNSQLVVDSEVKDRVKHVVLMGMENTNQRTMKHCTQLE